jgi:hypothetical protein
MHDARVWPLDAADRSPQTPRSDAAWGPPRAARSRSTGWCSSVRWRGRSSTRAPWTSTRDSRRTLGEALDRAAKSKPRQAGWNGLRLASRHERHLKRGIDGGTTSNCGDHHIRKADQRRRYKGVCQVFECVPDSSTSVSVRTRPVTQRSPRPPTTPGRVQQRTPDTYPE